MKRILTTCMWMLLVTIAWSQGVTLGPSYAFRTDTLSYGTSTTYRGCTETHAMTVYKPLNNFTNRPIVVMLHGGVWVDGGRHDVITSYMGEQLAQRGYVAASIDYRLGYHIQPSINPSFGCSAFTDIVGTVLSPCMYAADSAEVSRAMYRAMQDAKTAIRFMRTRTAQDSTDGNMVYLLGEGSGAFAALQTAFMDTESEKPAAAGALAACPTPGAQTCSWNDPCGSTSLQRPDLGSVRGTEYLSERDDVMGVIAMSGGIDDLAILQQNAHSPRLYLYHQSCDPIVPYAQGKLYEGLHQCMNDITPSCFSCPQIVNVPHVTGSGGLYDHLQSSGYPGFLLGDFLQRGEPINEFYGCNANGNCGPLNPCPYCLNTDLYDCHSTFLTVGRVDSISEFLYDCVTDLRPREASAFGIAPNPAEDMVELSLPPNFAGAVHVLDVQGRTLRTREVHGPAVTLSIAELPSGLYFMRLVGADGLSATLRLVHR